MAAMKRTALRRKTPIRASRKPLRPRSVRRPEPAPEDRERLAWLRSLPCCGPGPHLGAVAPHHETHGRGLGQRSSHQDAIPLCWGCHRAFHDASGPFRGWDRERRRAWQAEQVARHRALWDWRPTEDGYERVRF
jgi:hypothetical protein